MAFVLFIILLMRCAESATISFNQFLLHMIQIMAVDRSQLLQSQWLGVISFWGLKSIWLYTFFDLLPTGSVRDSSFPSTSLLFCMKCRLSSHSCLIFFILSDQRWKYYSLIAVGIKSPFEEYMLHQEMCSNRNHTDATRSIHSNIAFTFQTRLICVLCASYSIFLVPVYYCLFSYVSILSSLIILFPIEFDETINFSSLLIDENYHF